MRILILIVALLFAFPLNAQEEKPKKNFFKEFYNDFFKYATVYGAGDYRAPYESSDKKYLIRQPEGAGLYDVPIVEDVTEYFPSDYRIGFGIRKLGRFGYERKPGNFWTGDQNLERQKYIDQTQSLNLSFDPNDSPKWINQVHMEGWKLGVKTFYYLRTDSVIKGDLGSHQADCISCDG